MLSDVPHIDTLVVRAGRILEIPGNVRVPLTGVLRSEVRDRVATEVLKYVKALEVQVTPLMRVGILGEVAHPGYFGFTSDIPLADAIMGAGGPTATADMGRSIVRRGNAEFRSAVDTREAIAKGLTLDQFGVSAGDDIIVGKARDISNGPWLALLGAIATIVTIVVALQH
jgi:protein involved in polysaccharide export with SLBB domain